MSKKDKLQRENDSLVQNILDKMEVIEELEAQVNDLQAELTAIHCVQRAMAPEIPTTTRYKPLIKNDRSWTFSFELVPTAWSLYYYRYDWRKGLTMGHGKAREGQINFGPFGFSWFKEPKRV